jgi:anti-sigma28 factor (negative regulator of flagellin synthesis)
MIISGAEIESAISAYRTSVKRKPRSDRSAPAADRYDFSDETSMFSHLAAQVASEPYYRPNLVSELQRRVAEGRYFVPSDQIVEKLLGRLFAEALPA